MLDCHTWWKLRDSYGPDVVRELISSTSSPAAAARPSTVAVATWLGLLANAHLVAAAPEVELAEYPIFENDPLVDTTPDPGMYPFQEGLWTEFQYD